MAYTQLDKKVLEKQKTQPKRYSFDMSDIDQKIEAPFLTKNGEQLYLYRKKFRIKDFTSINSSVHTVFYIINSDGEVCGRIPVYMNEKPNLASIDYFFKPDFQNKGMGSVTLACVISQLFAGQIFDGLEFNTNQGRIKSHIEKITLAINIDNIPSRKLARKFGFEEDENDPTQFTLTKDKYFNRKSQNLGEKV